MYTTFSEITQHVIKITLSKKYTRLLALIMFYETRGYNPKKPFKIFSFVVYRIIKAYVFIDYLFCISKTN